MRKLLTRLLMVLGMAVLVFPTFLDGAGEAKEPIVLGCVQSLTGPGTAMGIPAKAAYEIARDEINAMGGILGHPIKIEVVDDKTNPEQGLRMAKHLVVDKKVNWLLGGGSSAVALAISGYAKSIKLPYIVGQPASSSITEEYGHRYLFRIGDNTVAQSRLAAFMVKTKWPDAKNVFQIEHDYEYGHFRATQFKNLWAKIHPGSKITNVWVPLGSYDFTAYMSQLMSKASAIDVVIDGIWGADGLALCKQAVAYGAYKKFKWLTACGDISCMGVLKKGDPAPIGALGSSAYPFWALDNPMNNKLWPEIKKRSGWWASNASAYAYTDLYALKKAYEKAGTTDVEKVIDAMEGLKIDTPMGVELEIRKVDHQTTWPFYGGIMHWDDKWPFPVFTELIGPDPKDLYHTEKEVLEVRAKAKKKKK